MTRQFRQRDFHAHITDPQLPFISRIPGGWASRRGKYLFRRMNRPVRIDDEIVTAFRDGTVTLRKNRREQGFTNSIKEIGYQGVRRGDLVIHAMDGFAGAIGVSDSDGKATPVYSVCTPISASNEPRYFAYLLREMARNGVITSRARGIRERSTEFRFNDFGELYLPVPPLEEQRAIAAFLDRETAKIDELIAKKQRLIELLHKKRQAAISSAVTKGFDSNVPTKPSGIDWAGHVPAHWDVVPLRWCIGVRSGDGLANTEFALDSDQGRIVPVVGGNGVMGYTDKSNNSASTIVIGRVGALCGNIHPIDPPTWVTDNALVITHIHRFHRDFLVECLRALDLNRWSNQNAQPLITGTLVKNQKVPCPPIDEQSRIVQSVAKSTTENDLLAEMVRRASNHLREYRSAIISAAVTGQIDVRNYREEAPCP